MLNPGAPTDSANASPYVGALITAGVPQYYGLPAPAPWNLYHPTNLIQQSTAATNGTTNNRRPLSPNSVAAAAAAANNEVTNGYSIVPYYPDQNASILMAQNAAALRNGTPLRLLSPSLLMQQQANRQNPNIYSNTQNMYGNPVLNGGALNGNLIQTCDFRN